MAIFWLAASALIMLALAFVLVPLLWGRRHLHADRQALNVEIARERLKELEADLANGVLDQARFAEARRDLEADLLHDVKAEHGQAASRKAGYGLAVTLVFVMPLSAVALYQLLGNDAVWSSGPAVQSTPDDTMPGSLEAMLGRLVARLEAEPGNVADWIMLGRSLMMLGRYEEATWAYQKALPLAPEDPEPNAGLAEALLLSESTDFTKIHALLETALKADPEHPKALWLSGFLSFQEGQFTQALAYWRALQQQLPADSEQAQLVATGITRVEQALAADKQAPVAMNTGQVESSAQTNPNGGPNTQAELTVQVSLDPALQNRVTPQDNVFVFARARQGSPMPLAVERLQARDLPTTITLDDGDAMMPTARLSSVSEVVVGARISKSGQAMAQSGDFEAISFPVDPQSGAQVELNINQVIP